MKQSTLKSVVSRFGSKAPLVHKIVPILEAIPHKYYCEPFGGGAAVLLSKSPALVETYNDIDGELVNFFKVLADEQMFERFYRRVSALPSSRALWREANRARLLADDPVERAVHWFIVARQSFGGWFGASWAFSRTAASGGLNPLLPGSTSTSVRSWLNCITGLPAIHSRLQRVQFECMDWRKVLETYDTPDTLFYLDPPYVPDTRTSGEYEFELSTEDHKELVERLLALNGSWALSGYEHEIYKPLVEAGAQLFKWRSVCYSAAKTRATGYLGTGALLENAPRTECLWVMSRQKRLL